MAAVFEAKRAFYGSAEGRFFEAGDRFEVDSAERIEALRAREDFILEIPSAELGAKPKKASGKRG